MDEEILENGTKIKQEHTLYKYDFQTEIREPSTLRLRGMKHLIVSFQKMIGQSLRDCMSSDVPALKALISTVNGQFP